MPRTSRSSAKTQWRTWDAIVELGQGTIGIDFAAILRELEEMRFRGWVVVEQSRSDVSPLASAQVNAAYLRRLGYDPGAAG